MKYWIMTAVLAYMMPVQAAVVTTYLPPSNAHEAVWQAEIKNSGINETVADLSAQYFPFQHSVHIVYGGDEGPFFDPQSNSVHIPYLFYAQAKDYFADNGYAARFGRTAEQGALDTLLHTVLHEMGHAYIANQDIAVLGKEEDAADDFATIMLLNGVDGGADIAISAADMFAFEANSADRPDYYQAVAYLDEHSLDLQRYFATLCLVYGSDPEHYAGLLDQISKDALAEREDYCRGRFAEVTDNWQRFLHGINE